MTAVTKSSAPWNTAPRRRRTTTSLAWLEKHARPLRSFHRRTLRAAGGGRVFRRRQSGARQPLGRMRAGRRRRMSTRPSPPRARPSSRGRSSRAMQRARHLYAIARILQKRERFFSVLETMDNGKPIRESRDIDIPLVARHFYHHAGWAELIESEFPGYAPVGVCGQIIPWNFPLLMLAWKIAPALAAGNTVVLKPAEFTPLTALAFAELCQEAGLPPGVVNIVTGDGATGALHRRASGRRQDRLHRLDRSRPHHPRGDRRHGQEAVARARRQVALHRLRRRRPRQRGRGRGRRDLVQPGPGLLRRLAPASCRKASRSGSTHKLRARMETLRVGDPLDKSTDIGAIVADVQLERIRALVEQGRREGAHAAGSRKARCRPRRLLLSRRRWSPGSRPPRSWRRRRSSGRCSSR